MEPISTPPQLSDFTLLSAHLQQTPTTFFQGPPVLHLHAPSSILKLSLDQYESHKPLLSQLLPGPPPATSDNETISIEDVDVWVTSQHLLLFAPSLSTGLKIEYPTITVTAQDGADVLLEMNLSDQDTADEDIEFLQLRISATTVRHHAGSEGGGAEDAATAGAGASAGANGNGTTRTNDSATALFKAVSDCQELNPDPPQAGDSDGYGEEGEDETAPGATGWITGENMADYMDEHGNLRMPGGDAGGVTVIGDEDGEGEMLGQGAGRTRRAAEVNDAGDDAVDGEESKWRRTG